MSKVEVTITPGGRLRLADESWSSGQQTSAAAAKSHPQKLGQATVANGWIEAFSDSSAAGILAIQQLAPSEKRTPSLDYWGRFGQQFFHRLCHQPHADPKQWATLSVPGLDELEQTVAAAPPMRGLEFLTTSLLASIWRELAELVSVEASASKQPSDYLQSVNPQLHLLGRVTFHLAENKLDPARPFAFMATYTNRVSKSAKLQHLPLGQAVQQYAGVQDRETLQSLLFPISRAAEQDSLTRELLESKAIFYPQAWTVQQAHRLLLAGEVLESCGLVLRLPDWWKKGKSRRVVVRVEVGNKKPSLVGADSLLKFSANLALDGKELSAKEAQQILSLDSPLVLLRGQWVEVDRDKLSQTLDHWESLSESHPNGIDFLAGMRLISGVSVNEEEAELDTARDWQFVSAGDWLREKLEGLRDPEGSASDGLVSGLNATLRPYQEAGVKWLWFLSQLGIGGCLADDMGLGKTIQVIALLHSIKVKSKTRSGGTAQSKKASLLIVPASLVGNWRQEIEKFAPDLKVFYAHQSESTKEKIDELASNHELIPRFDLVITTYGLARRWKWLSDVDWKLIVLDEAQAIKNPGSAQTKAIKKLNSETNFALTGTPVENHLGDLWSLMDFSCPGLLGSAKQFKSYVARLQKSEHPRAYAPLRQLVQPYILRRMKTDPQIAPELPSKTEMRCECTLSKKQVALYQDAVKQLKWQLESQEMEGIARHGLVLSSLMKFKQICNHPSQFLGKPDFEVADSGKLQRLTELCRVIRERQEKLLLFTQFRGITEQLAEFLASEFGHQGLVLHGGTNVKRRNQMVAEFQQDDGPSFFVISLKAGGTGLNLTAASHVIHFDRWWNPAVENQATDRAFRIGQKNKVLVHKFVCRGTVEENIDRMISEKQQLSDDILGQDPNADSQSITELNDDQLIELISLDLNRAIG